MTTLGEHNYPAGVTNADFAGGDTIVCPHCNSVTEIGPECSWCEHELTDDDLEDTRA